MVETHEKEGKQCMEKQSTIIEDILSKDNLNRAYQQVIKNKVAAVLKQALGVAVRVKLVEPKTIERSEGKAKRVIDNRGL